MKQIEDILQNQRVFFRTGKTIPLPYRRAALDRLAHAIRAHEAEIGSALKADLNKSETESYLCEIGMTLSELSYIRRHMTGWAKKEY
ncbi:MAG: aldehyde dehydrogenase family protein, partial [Bacillota bacterium]|nr:aldehyde dehydrogenase family protein [Bacillota bacterium]